MSESAGMSSIDLNRLHGVGKAQSKHGRVYTIEAKNIISAEQSEPLTILHGRAALSCVQLCPVFNLIVIEQGGSNSKDAAKDGKTSGTVYYAGFAVAVCAGPVKNLYKISINDDIIWESEDNLPGDITSVDSNETFKTIETGNGAIRIYSGTTIQRVDATLANMEIVVNTSEEEEEKYDAVHPSYKNICYVISDFFCFGTMSSMPNITFEVGTIPTALEDNKPQAFTLPDGWVENFPHVTDSGDCYPPEIIYDFLTNTVWGAGIEPEKINYQSFIDAQAYCVTNGISISSTVDSTSSVRDIILQLLEYINGVIFLDDLLIAIRILCWNDTALETPVITQDILTSEPEIKIDNKDVWNVTTVNFNDRAAEYENTNEVYEYPLYNGDEIISKKFDLPWIRNRKVALDAARRLGSVGAYPSIEYTFKCLEGSVNGLKVGDLVKVEYDKANLENLRLSFDLRIYQINYGAPESVETTIVGRKEYHTRYFIDTQENETTSYVSSGTYIPPTVFKDGGAMLARALFSGSSQYLCFYSERPNIPIKEFRIYRQKNNLDDFDLVWKSGTTFPIPIEIIDIINNGSGYIRIRFAALKYFLDGDNNITSNKTGRPEYILSAKNSGVQDFSIVTQAKRVENGVIYNTGYPMEFSVNTNTIDSVEDNNYTEAYQKEKWHLFSAIVTPGFNSSITPGVFYGQVYNASQHAYVIKDNKFIPRIKTFDNDYTDIFVIQSYYNSSREDLNEPIEKAFRLSWNSFSSTEHSGYVETIPENIWGNSIVLDSGGSGVLGYSCSPEEDGDIELQGNYENGTLLVDYKNKNTYYYNSDTNTWIQSNTITYHENYFDERYSATNHLHDDRYQLIGDSAERYYRSFSASASLSHVRGSDGRVNVHLIDEIPITITLPSVADAENGDVITVFFSAENDVEQNVVTFEADADEVFANGQNEVVAGTGTILQLVCVEAGWLTILKSILEE